MYRFIFRLVAFWIPSSAGQVNSTRITTLVLEDQITRSGLSLVLQISVGKQNCNESKSACTLQSEAQSSKLLALRLALVFLMAHQHEQMEHCSLKESFAHQLGNQYDQLEQQEYASALSHEANYNDVTAAQCCS